MGPLACLSPFTVMRVDIGHLLRSRVSKLPCSSDKLANQQVVNKWLKKYDTAAIVLYINRKNLYTKRPCLEQPFWKLGFQMVGTRTERPWAIRILNAFGIWAPTVFPLHSGAPGKMHAHEKGKPSLMTSWAKVSSQHPSPPPQRINLVTHCYVTHRLD